MCFDHHHFLPLFFCLACWRAWLDDGNWYHFGSLLICLLVAVCRYWFVGTQKRWRWWQFYCGGVGCLSGGWWQLWGRVLNQLERLDLLRGAHGRGWQFITSLNRCDLKIWIRKEHHQRSYLVHLNLCSHLFYVLRPRALLHISQLHMLSDILLHNILHEHTDGV